MIGGVLWRFKIVVKRYDSKDKRIRDIIVFIFIYLIRVYRIWYVKFLSVFVEVNYVSRLYGEKFWLILIDVSEFFLKFFEIKSRIIVINRTVSFNL